MSPVNKLATIVQGSDINLVITILDKNTGKVFPLTGLTAASVSFKNADNTTLTKSATVKSSDRGELECSLTKTDTAALEPGDSQDIKITIDQGTKRSIAQPKGVLAVEAAVF
jgi:hypothetical protein